MMDFHTVAVQRRQLRAGMRKARRDQGLSHQQAAALLSWSASKVIRLETGASPAQPSDVLALLTAYGVDKPRIDELFAIARGIRENHSMEWRDRLSKLHSPAYLSYLESEQAAMIMKEWHSYLFPGLMQTKEYSREILVNVFANAPEEAEERIENRIDRQQLVSSESGPRFHFILDEAVLRRPIGPPKTMIGQLERMLEVAQLDRVTVQLVPFECGPNPGMRGPFILLEFADDADDSLYMETPRGDFFSRDDVETTSEYQEIFGALDGLSLKDEEMQERVSQVIQELKRL